MTSVSSVDRRRSALNCFDYGRVFSFLRSNRFRPLSSRCFIKGLNISRSYVSYLTDFLVGEGFISRRPVSLRERRKVWYLAQSRVVFDVNKDKVL